MSEDRGPAAEAAAAEVAAATSRTSDIPEAADVPAAATVQVGDAAKSPPHFLSPGASATVASEMENANFCCGRGESRRRVTAAGGRAALAASCRLLRRLFSERTPLELEEPETLLLPDFGAEAVKALTSVGCGRTEEASGKEVRDLAMCLGFRWMPGEKELSFEGDGVAKENHFQLPKKTPIPDPKPRPEKSEEEEKDASADAPMDEDDDWGVANGFDDRYDEEDEAEDDLPLEVELVKDEDDSDEDYVPQVKRRRKRAPKPKRTPGPARGGRGGGGGGRGRGRPRKTIVPKIVKTEEDVQLLEEHGMVGKDLSVMVRKLAEPPKTVSISIKKEEVKQEVQEVEEEDFVDDDHVENGDETWAPQMEDEEDEDEEDGGKREKPEDDDSCSDFEDELLSMKRRKLQKSGVRLMR